MHRVKARGLLSAENTMNLYRGCQHGCIYCDSRSRCYHMDHAFEDIEVKENAPELLEQALRRKREKCMIGTGAMGDPYIPLERELGLTRRCLEIVARYGFGLGILTKSADILRDLDLLCEIHRNAKCVVQMTLTTCDEKLCRILEPGVSTTGERAEVLFTLRDEGIPTVVWLSPLLPYINDSVENLAGILDYCIRANVYGVICFDMGMTLREGNREYYYSRLERHFPGLKERYIREFGNSYQVASPNRAQLWAEFHRLCGENGIVTDIDRIFTYLRTFENRNYQQMKLDLR